MVFLLAMLLGANAERPGAEGLNQRLNVQLRRQLYAKQIGLKDAPALMGVGGLLQRLDEASQPRAAPVARPALSEKKRARVAKLLEAAKMKAEDDKRELLAQEAAEEAEKDKYTGGAASSNVASGLRGDA